jgi:7-carboxy-7-deazaguanine synthase
MATQRVTLHDDRVQILSMFLTVDGECNLWAPGTGSVFIRTVGCDVGCSWCDTKYSWSWSQGEVLSIPEISARAQELAKHLPVKKITLTGGEPLQQWHNGVKKLIDHLLFNGWKISIETSGSIAIPDVLKNAPNVCLVVDYKLASANVDMHPVESNFDESLGPRHYIKFVITDIDDFFAAVSLSYSFRQDGCAAQIYFSPAFGKVTPRELFTWMKNNKRCQLMGVKYNLQMHKFIFSSDWRDEEQDVQT